MGGLWHCYTHIMMVEDGLIHDQDRFGIIMRVINTRDAMFAVEFIVNRQVLSLDKRWFCRLRD